MLQPTSCVFIKNPLCRSRRLPWQKSSVNTWFKSDSNHQQQEDIKKTSSFRKSIEIQKYPTCLLHRREPVCAKALKLNFFTNYYFFLLLLFAVLPLRIFPPPSLKIESNSLYIQLFYERKKNLMKKLLLTTIALVQPV